MMPTISYKEGIKSMVDRNPKFAMEILEDAINSLLDGNLEEGRLLLRHYIDATIGFQELARRTGKRDKSLMRSLSATENLTASNLFDIIRACVQARGATVAARVIPHTNRLDPEPAGM